MCYLGGTTRNAAEAPANRTVLEILADQAPDPAALRRIDWEPAPFFCPDCASNLLPRRLAPPTSSSKAASTTALWAAVPMVTST